MIIRLITLIVFLSAATVVHAQTVFWSSAGTACVPDGNTVGKYDSFNPAAIRFAGTKVGIVVFTCHVQRFDSFNQSWRLKMAYRDSTGPATSASVVARIYRISLSGFTSTLVGEVNSDSSAVLVNTTLSGDFNHTFDFETSTYFVQITLTRAAITEMVRLYSAELIIGDPS